MLKIYINNNWNIREIPTGDFERLALEIYRAGELNEKGELSITFMDDEEIAALNKKYRNIDGPTDVLSFPQREGMEIPDPDDEDFEPLLGDIMISTEAAARQANEMGHSFEKEIKILLIHGILHLYGYDHYEPEEAALMKKEEEKILAVLEGE